MKQLARPHPYDLFDGMSKFKKRNSVGFYGQRDDITAIEYLSDPRLLQHKLELLRKSRQQAKENETDSDDKDDDVVDSTLGGRDNQSLKVTSDNAARISKTKQSDLDSEEVDMLGSKFQALGFGMEEKKAKPSTSFLSELYQSVIDAKILASDVSFNTFDLGEESFEERFAKTAIIPPSSKTEPLTQEEEELVNRIMRGGQHGQLAQFKSAIVEYKDIYKLRKETWLNDEIINFYLALIADRADSSEGTLPSVHCFSTFFCSTLRESGYNKVRRWTKKVDIFSKDLLFIPINYSYHWTLGAVDVRNKRIAIYDSMGGRHDVTLKLLLKYLEDEHQDKKKAPLDTSDWVKETPKDIPQQGNMSDCGVFTCTFAERLSRQQPFDFSQDDMEQIRKCMVLSIAQQKIRL